jgi:hypothetical protein
MCKLQSLWQPNCHSSKEPLIPGWLSRRTKKAESSARLEEASLPFRNWNEDQMQMIRALGRRQDRIKGTASMARVWQFFGVLIVFLSVFTSVVAQEIAGSGALPGSGGDREIVAPDPQPGSISGTVMDTNGDIVPGAAVVLEVPAPGQSRTIVATDDGAFHFDGLKPGIPYHITISANGFVSWKSPAIILSPGQFVYLKNSTIAISGGATSVTVYSSPEQIAVEQVKVEEQQRVFGFIPNFYAVYDRNAAPLTAKLKFELALRADTDPITFIGVGLLAGSNQAADRLDYGQGVRGYSQRLGAVYADGFTDIMIGGAILPSLLHQDPRYFYQGTGTKKSRVFHALSSPFICRGDNGRRQPNYSTMGGDLASAAISNTYYPATNRGADMVISNVLINTAEREAADLAQEFILRRFTPGSRTKPAL